MRVIIEGHDLPGRRSCGQPDVHVGLRVRNDVVEVVPGDVTTASWECDVRVGPGKDGGVDFFGPAVHGARGDRHLALRWLSTRDVHAAAFRGAKLKLEQIDPDLVAAATEPGRALVASIHLTDERGEPRCATVKPPALAWSVR